jgi:hypothetical protein
MTSDRRASFFDELAAIAQDPRVKRLALRRAGDPDLAEDALQQAYCAVALVDRPDRIDNLHAYFRRVLVRTTDRLLAYSGATAVDPGDLALLSGDRGLLLQAISADFESELHTVLQVEGWLTRLRNEQDWLAASVPRRSEDPGRYQTAIIAAAGKILGMVMDGNVDGEDWTAILRSEYPEWFARPDVPGHVRTRRLQDARKDARTLLKGLLKGEYAPRQVSLPEFIRTEPPDECARTADDVILSALFLKAEQALLPHEMPYNLEQELQMFSVWLDRQP